MRIETLHIENFLAIGDAELKLSERGLMLVEGVNADDTSADSNGSGKSSIVDALCWALYGQTARGETGDAVVNSHAKKNTEVCVVMDDDGTPITITRYRKHKKHKNRLTVHINSKDATKGTDKDTQELVVKLLGCTYEVFRAAVYSGQESMPDLPSMTDKNLKILVEEAAGINLIEEAYGIARKRVATTKAEVTEIGVTLDHLDTTLAQAREMLVDQQAAAEGWSDQRKARAEPIVKNIKGWRGERAMLEERIEKFNAQGLPARLKQITDKIASQAATEAALKQADKRHRDAEIAQGAAEREASARSATVERLTADLEDLKGRGAPVCETCAQPMDDEKVAALIERNEDRITEAQAASKLATNAMIEANSNMLNLHEELVKAQKAVPDQTKLIEGKYKVESAIRDNKCDEDEITERNKREEADLKQLEDIKAETNPWLAKLETTKKSIDSREKGIVSEKFKLKTAERLLAVQTAASEAFSPAGVRAHILDTVTPFLNSRTGDYLSVLSDGNMRAIWNTVSKTASGELREKFQINVESDTGGNSFKAMSGGEKRKVRLACALALQDLVASRATKPFEIWIGDEIDDALDPAGLERLMTILKDKASSRGTVLVISHNSLRDWISNAFAVTKTGGVSTVTEAS